MAPPNLNQLRTFRTIAREGGIAAAAKRLHLSPSALSIQLAALEASLGHALFHRQGRRLVLTEAGRIALEHADAIVRGAEDLVLRLKGHAEPLRTVRIGAVATISRNFQVRFLRPLFARGDIEVVLRAGSLDELLAQLAAHTLDLVLATTEVTGDAALPWRSLLLAEQPVSLIGRARDRRKRLAFPADLDGLPMLLPSRAATYRAGYDLLIEQAGVRPKVLAEVDDMTMLRLLSRELRAVALVPPLIVERELAEGSLRELHCIPGLTQRFYAITLGRRFPNPLVAELLTTAREAETVASARPSRVRAPRRKAPGGPSAR